MQLYPRMLPTKYADHIAISPPNTDQTWEKPQHAAQWQSTQEPGTVQHPTRTVGHKSRERNVRLASASTGGGQDLPLHEFAAMIRRTQQLSGASALEFNVWQACLRFLFRDLQKSQALMSSALHFGGHPYPLHQCHYRKALGINLLAKYSKSASHSDSKFVVK